MKIGTSWPEEVQLTPGCLSKNILDLPKGGYGKRLDDSDWEARLRHLERYVAYVADAVFEVA